MSTKTDKKPGRIIVPTGFNKTIPAGHITKPGKMTILTFEGKTIFVTGLVNINECLEPGRVYSLNVDFHDGGMWLTEDAPLELPSKVYDFEQDFRGQILDTLKHPNGNMNVGVLLEGYKGQGKSVIGKQLAIESGLPVIKINGRIPRMCNFLYFLGQIKQDYCLFLDEFEKNFHNDDYKDDKDKDYHGQNSFLSLLDGVNGLRHKRLVVMTSNSSIGDKFMNRPSRIRYYKKFNFMNKKVFEAIVKDKLKNKKFKKDLEDHLDVPSCTIDILTTIIEEINIHDKPYSEFKSFFNRVEKETTYVIKKYNEESKRWEDHDEIKTTKEIGVESEYAEGIFGYGIKVLKNDGEVIIYQNREPIYDEKDEFTGKYKTATFKASKKLWSSTQNVSTAFTL